MRQARLGHHVRADRLCPEASRVDRVGVMPFMRSFFQREASARSRSVHRAGLGAPRAPWFFAAGMSVSLLIAIFGGLLLGALAATDSGFADERWTETVQAHGDLQLYGWVAVFISILTFEFIVRLNGRAAPLPLAGRVAVVVSLALGAILRAVGQVWNGRAEAAWPAGAALIVLGSLVFAVLVFSVRPANPVRKDPQSLWFRAAALWLIVAAIAGLAGAIRGTGGVMALSESAFVVELTVRGFIMNSVLAVAVRAFPGHLEVPAIERQRHGLLFVFVNVSLVLWMAGSGAFGLGDTEWLRQLGNMGLGATLLLATWWLGVPALFRHRIPLRPYYRAMIPLAWVGLVAYAVALGAAAIFPGWGERDLFAVGAIRHIFMLGFMAPLMIAMSDIVLSRFGTGEIRGERWIPVGFALVVVSWPLRVVLPLFTSESSTLSHTVFGSAAIFAAAGLALVAWVCARNALAIRGRVLASRSGVV